MPGITLKERQQINHEIKKLGFGGLDDPTIFQQIATLYSTHDSFRGLLLSTRPDQRRIAYEALKPHLCFVAKPLDVYEREIHERAEREQWDVIERDNPHFPRPFRPTQVETEEYRLERLAQEAIRQTRHEKESGLYLACDKCTRVEVFQAKLRKHAERDSHKAGWRSDGQKSWCPNCVPARCTMNLACQMCGKEQKIRCWEPQDGYATARLMGWVIEDAATCASCAVPKVVLQ